MTTTSPRRPGGAEAMREAAAKVARSTHMEEVRDPGIYGHADQYYSVRVPNFPTDGEQIAALIEALPLPAGDTLSTGGWNSDMEKAPRDRRKPFLLATRSFLGGVAMVCWPPNAPYPVDEEGDTYPDGTAWQLLPEPPPGE